MRFLNGLFTLAFFVTVVGCSGNNKSLLDNYKSNYSIEVEGKTNTAITDNLPLGISVNAASHTIHKDVVVELSSNGLIRCENHNRYKVKFDILSFGHKWASFINNDYYIKYKVRMIDENTSVVIASTINDIERTDLVKLIDVTAEHIAYFTMSNIK